MRAATRLEFIVLLLVWELFAAACSGDPNRGASPSAASGDADAGVSDSLEANDVMVASGASGGSGLADASGGDSPAGSSAPRAGSHAANGGGNGVAGSSAVAEARVVAGSAAVSSSAGAAAAGTGGTSGAVASSAASGSAQRPFNDQSPWNTPIGQNPVLESNSTARIADLRTSSPYGEHLDVNISGFSIPMFIADATTPKQLVECAIGGFGFSGGSNGMNRSAMIPWPTGAKPDPQSDHHLLIVDRSTQTEWGMWNVAQKNGKWTCGLGASMDLTGSGVRPIAQDNPTWYTSHGPRACGFPLSAGLIRREEIEAGVIEHALVFAYPHIQAGLYTSPASTAQAKVGSDSIKSRGIPCGGRIQFDPNKNLDDLKLSRSGRAIMLALQKYGAYVGDYSGAINVYADGSPESQKYFKGGVLDTYELQNKINLADLRVLELGEVYDNGNGD